METLQKTLVEGPSEAKQYQAQEPPRAKKNLSSGTHGQYAMCLSWSCCLLGQHLGETWPVSAAGNRITGLA